jgi:uncharacterized membrane protein YfcA
VFQHAGKVLCFGVAGFDLLLYFLPCVVLCAAAFTGSLIGARLLDRVPRQRFGPLVRWVVTALAVLLIYQGLRTQ